MAWKVDHSVTDSAFSAMLTLLATVLFDASNILPNTWSLFKGALDSLLPIRTTQYDMCHRSCVAFTGEYSHLDACPVCGEARYEERQPGDRGPRRARATFSVHDVAERLRTLYASAGGARAMRYRANYVVDPARPYHDIFGGRLYRRVAHAFTDARDVALGLSGDGLSMFKRCASDACHELPPSFFPIRSSTSTTFPIYLVNFNLPPAERVKPENIITVAVIPGPNEPKRLNSFLLPIVEQLIVLETGPPYLFP